MEQKQEAYDEETAENTDNVKQKDNDTTNVSKDKSPGWYQDFSIDQIKNLMMLQCLMNQDCAERVVNRTQKTLLSIGIISTFFAPAPDVIKKLQESSNCSAIDFLREVYKVLTGNYFEEERYKDFYDCNERIILSAIAFLTLPEAVVELHKRLPPVTIPKLPPKPTAPALPMRQKMGSPYEEELFIRPDWPSYYNQLQCWKKECQLIPLPKVILPPKDCVLTNYKRTEVNSETRENRTDKIVSIHHNPVAEKRSRPNTLIREEQNKNTSISTKQKYDSLVKVKEKDAAYTSPNNPVKMKKNISSTNNPTAVEESDTSMIDTGDSNNEEFKQESDNAVNTNQEVVQDSEKSVALDIPPLYGGNRLFDFTINGISEKSGPVQYKLCGVLQPPQPNKKSWLGEKHVHYIISGAADEPPTCPVTYEMTGVANVTPINSDERFFAVLKLGDGPNKIYPSGRKNLSRHWQEWLQNVDEEFRKVEREANKMIKNIEAITKLVFPEPTCDSCCSCRQTRKSYLKAKETKAPYFVIDTITEDNNKNKSIIGSMAMHSPAPTPPESTVNLLEVIASEDVLTSNLVINGVTNEIGETQYFITGMKDDMVRVPRRIVQRPPPPPPRNVPPCVCTIQQIFNKDITPTLSQDNIPWTKDEGLCFGKKFRPSEGGAYSCKKYPGDKSCRRNPFRGEIMRRIHRAEREKREKERGSSKKGMYSIADFKPCGDEHGMGICGGPWGAVHTLTPEELAEEEKLRKEILKGPPCGTKAGRAVCEGPFGRRVSIKPQKKIEIESEIPGEEDLEEEEEIEESESEEEEKEPPPVKKEKEKKRDTGCYTSPEIIAAKKRMMEEKTEKFIPDPNYPGYDDPWNIFRTAPSKKESETDFKNLLKLSSPKPPSTPVPSRTLISGNEKSASKDSLKVSGKISKKSARKSDGKIAKRKSRSTSIKKETQIRGKKVSQETLQSDKIEDHRVSKPIKNKHDYRKLSTKTMSVKHLKNGNKLHQTVRTSKPTVENTKLKSKREKIDSFNEKASNRFNIKGKISKEGISDRSKINRTSARRSQLGKKSERKSNNPENIKINNPDRKALKSKRSSQLKSRSVLSTNIEKRKTSNAKKKFTKKDRKKDAQIYDVDSGIIRQNYIHGLKNMLKSPDIYPPDVKPVDIPAEPPTKCQPEYEYTETTDDSEKIDEGIDKQLPSKGPCGWRTKSEQKLPTKKTLVYLSEPDYPPETIAVRPGGKPCLCRENRAKKKILMYNIGGLIGSKKDVNQKRLFKRKKDEDDKQTQVIDGVIYYTPPPSPRRSDEYVPEYDLLKSPYDMCLTQRKDKQLKFLAQYTGPKISETSKNQDSCGCNEYVDTYGVQPLDQNGEVQTTKELEKVREELINAKPPEERWKLALNDVGLIDYFTRCRDSIPCWLKCAKFNKMGCSLPQPKLQSKRPVCECKYERKILEHTEEKQKWKEREKKLKSLKKQPYMNVADISKPVVANTKLMISGVKRIPRENEYIDDIKYCITGVAENYSESLPTQVVDGLHMSTPVQTPEPSEEKLPCVCSHKHWSAINIPPGPLPKPEEIILGDKKRRQEAVIKAFRQIYAPQKVYDTHDGHSCQEPCMPDSGSENNEIINENVRNNNSVKTSYSEKIMSIKSKSTNQKGQRKQLSNKQQQQQQMKLNSSINRKKSDTKNPIAQGTTENPIISSYKGNRNIENEGSNIKNPLAQGNPLRSSYKGNRNVENETSYLKNLRNTQSYENRNVNPQLQNESPNLNTENVNISDENIEEDYFDTDDHFMIIAQIELKKMATEGFLFAKLPKCFFMPQLQYWLMYRKGFVLNDADKIKSVNESIDLWNVLDVEKSHKIKTPPLDLTKYEITNLTFDNAKEMKQKIAMKKAIFYSQVRKNRVLYARTMWNTMEYGKFPSTSFKQAYFTYMASKEADGLPFKPWFPSDVRDMN
nr:uncharacterized protein LOC117610542 isoform X1 [Osmia lignaria]XP_034193984.1 uncharacterized protein LOC117610542 isoform X1 [Osmia lignaria]XP_034193985.1 uncharacterized protein LOC117610542 isoform X1 [Osmia lignaria]